MIRSLEGKGPATRTGGVRRIRCRISDAEKMRALRTCLPVRKMGAPPLAYADRVDEAGPRSCLGGEGEGSAVLFKLKGPAREKKNHE